MPPTTSAPLLTSGAAPSHGADGLPELRAARLALAAERQQATRARQHSRALCDRAGHLVRMVAASREFVEGHRELWRQWFRAWIGLTGPGTPRIVRVCAYCGAAARVGADPLSPHAWRPLPSWVRDHLADGTLGVRPSHGACPTCAEARLGI